MAAQFVVRFVSYRSIITELSFCPVTPDALAPIQYIRSTTISQEIAYIYLFSKCKSRFGKQNGTPATAITADRKKSQPRDEKTAIQNVQRKKKTYIYTKCVY